MEEVRAREEAQKQTAYYNLTFGTIGCYMSHFRAMKYIADNEAVDFGVVSEDDLSLFSPDFEKQFDKLVDDSEGQATKLWNSTDFIYLQACHLGWNRATIVKERLEIRTVLKDVSHQTVHCLGMYAVSRRAARWLTAPNGPLLPMKLQIDEILPVEVPNIRAKAFYPSIAQTLGSKDIGTDNQILLEPSDEPITWVDC